MAQRKNSGRKPRAAFDSARGPSATKSGPGRKHRGGKPGRRLTKARKQRASDALMAAWASKRVTKAALRDEHGAFTLVGHAKPGGAFNDYMTMRRKWLGGISAQRGY